MHKIFLWLKVMCGARKEGVSKVVSKTFSSGSFFSLMTSAQYKYE